MTVKIAVSVAVLIALFSAGWNFGADRVQHRWDKEKLALSEERRIAAEENQKAIKSLEDAKDENLKTISGLRVDLARARVRVPKTTCSGNDTTGGSANTPTGTGQQPETAQDAFDEFRRGLESDAEDTDKLIENCRVVMDWAKGFDKK